MLSKKYRLTKRGSFAYVYRKGESTGSGAFRMLFVRSSSLKIGFSVSNKLGKATVRNKLKRRMRAILCAKIKDIRGGYQIVFVAKPPAAQLSFDMIQTDIVSLLKRAKML